MDRVKHQKHGFSLIELSIALVIIGLIIGGIFVGTDLVKGAEIRSTLGQLESYKNAVHSFKAKYKCLPGDCANALSKGLQPAQGYWIGSVFIPAPADGDHGNDNGIVADEVSVFVAGFSPIYLEGANFWAHLENAGMISLPSTSGTYFRSPLSALGHGNWTPWSSVLDINALYITEQYNGVLTTAQARCGDAYCPALSPYEAFQIDKKIDDGLPHPAETDGAWVYTSGGDIGKVNAYLSFTQVGQNGSMNPISRGAAGSNNCLDNTKTPIAYNSQVNTPNLCLLQFKMDY